MGWQDRLIASCASWNEFWERTKKLSTDGQRGAAFERLTQLYLQTTPEYRAELRYVWTLREVPPDVCKRLNLPFLDEGIDLIACTRFTENIGPSNQNSAANEISPSTEESWAPFQAWPSIRAARLLWPLLHTPARSRSASVA
jgi:hypothetical protein